MFLWRQCVSKFTLYGNTICRSVSVLKDAYNFYHSRCCIRVECAFGMLTERWGILRSTMPRNITICKTIALVYLLARLHNFCIQQNDSVNVAQSLFSDELRIERLGGIPLESTQYTNGQRIPEQLIGGGHWFSDHNQSAQRSQERFYQVRNVALPRETLTSFVQQQDLSRPIAKSTAETNQ